MTESLLLLMRRGFVSAQVSFCAAADGGIQVRVTGEEGAAAVPLADEDEIALALLNALAEDVAMTGRTIRSGRLRLLSVNGHERRRTVPQIP